MLATVLATVLAGVLAGVLATVLASAIAGVFAGVFAWVFISFAHLRRSLKSAHFSMHSPPVQNSPRNHKGIDYCTSMA